MIRTPITDVDVAARALLHGALVVLPTETVYGLAARADDRGAVGRIFTTKGRPHRHPLIVHVADGDAALAGVWGRDAAPMARTLAAQFWPGPLTLVVPRGPWTTDEITGGQATVAIRVPAHPIARAVLQRMDEVDPAGAPHGLAAPSANRFGRVSPTTVAHAVEELADSLGDDDVFLDGGPCEVGVESTIVDCTGAVPRILRPGGVSAEEIAAACGCAVDVVIDGHSEVRVPGSMPSHYAPKARVIVAPDLAAAMSLVAASNEAGGSSAKVGLLAPAEYPTPEGLARLAEPETTEEYARVLYAALRAADDRGLAVVVAVPPEESDGLAAAVRDRLQRSAAPRP